MGGQLTDEVVRASALTRKMAVERERMDIILSALNTGLALMDAELNVVWVNEGTLFLDEISELPTGTQAKLLRVVQESQFERVGSSRTINHDEYSHR